MSEIRQQLQAYDLVPHKIVFNASPAELYEASVQGDHAVLTSSGALAATSGDRTGRSPADKRIVENPESQHQIWWGDVNMPLRPMSYKINRRRAIDFLSSQSALFVVDGFAGWDPRYRIKVRMISARPYHALFMHNMLIRPTATQLKDFGEPDFTIFNAGTFPADPLTPDVVSPVSININLETREMVILGTQYAGEMKKGIFSIMHYLMPPQNVLSMHCAANEGQQGDVTLFFGLSGTGKTTLSADARRKLIGDDEHAWSDTGVFNFEGGCYAKCINLSREKEPIVYDAIRFGCVLENTVQDSVTREVDFDDASLTHNTRASYPIEFVKNAKIPCIGGHPKNIIFLTCDAFGILPPVSRLTAEQASFHFINGYTAKVVGTEVGVTEPQATFSACYGAAFLTRTPACYAELLKEKIERFQPDVWLINTGWTGGNYRSGHRIAMADTRAIIDAIHDGSLQNIATVREPVFGLAVPTSCPDVPSDLLQPRETWDDQEGYDKAAWKLKQQFDRNHASIEHQCSRVAIKTSEYHRAGI